MTLRTALRFILTAVIMLTVLAWVMPADAGERHRGERDDRARKDDRRRDEKRMREERFHEMLKLLKKHRPELYEKLMKLKEKPDLFRREVIAAAEKLMVELKERKRERHGDRERGDRPRDDRPRDDRPRHEERPRHDDDERPRHDDRERRGHDEDPDMPSLDEIERKAKDIMHEIKERAPEMYEKLMDIKKREPKAFLRVLRDMWMDLMHREDKGREREERDMPSLDEIADKVKSIIDNEDILAEFKREAPDVFELLMAIKKHGFERKFLERLRDIWMEREREEGEEEDEPTLDDIAKMAKDILRNKEELEDIKRHSPDFFELLMKFKKHGPRPEILERLRDNLMEDEEECEEEDEGEIHELMENLEKVLHEIRKRAPDAYRELMKLREHEPEEFPRVLLDIWRDLHEDEGREREHEEERRIGPEEEEKILDFLKKNNPGWFEELMQVRRKNPDAYRHALMRARNEARELKELIEEDPQRAEDIILNNRLTHRQWQLVEKYKRAESKEAREKIRVELRGVLNKLFDVRLRKWKRHIEELAQEIEEMKKEEAEFRKEKESIIEEKLKELLGKPRRRFPGE
ncbi:MAG: hypothetical protein E3J72_08300 [Planctomycetota bacterium]|nr:MAG: hypothetical protein E3J72_08300 [Planctomycetota bacterium]